VKHPFINRVETTNFRNFREFAVDLDATAVIVGENQAGKGNFLDALCLVLDPSVPDSARKLRAEDFWDGLQDPFAGHTIEVKVFMQNFEDNEGTKAILSDCIIDSSPLTAQLTYQYRPITKLEKMGGGKGEDPILTEDDYDFVVFGGSEESNLIGSEIRKWLTLVLLPALRDA
jgi:putative ATP-dependent endonuclease of OLD family